MSIRHKQQIYKSFFLSGNPAFVAYFKKYANLLTKIKCAAKRLYYKKKIEEGKYNSRTTWQVLREFISTKKNLNLPTFIRDESNVSLNDPKLIAEAFNKHFSDIGDKLAAKIQTKTSFKSFLKGRNPNSMALVSPTFFEIYNVIHSLKNKKSFGVDTISSYFLKVASLVITPYLMHLFNACFNNGLFPEVLKVSKVIPIYKSGDKTKVNNYRPISLLPSLSKVMEKLLVVRLTSFLNASGILYDRQYGFRKKRTTTQAVLDLVTNLYDNISKNKLSSLVAVDLTKAFDTVNHKILLEKLDYYGIRGICNDLIRSYLSNRQQTVYIAQESSTMRLVKSGVPQGSVLGPLLFIIYINDLHFKLLCSTVQLFADDTCLLLSNICKKTLQDEAKTELENLHLWMDANKLTLNLSKSNVMLINSKLRDKGKFDNIKTKKSEICITSTVKYLGIYIDEELNFKYHITSIVAKISRGVGILYKIKNFLPTSTLLCVYYSHVHTHLSYGIIIWGSTYKSHLEKLTSLQNKAIRAVGGAGWNESSSPLYYKFKVLKFHDIYKYELAKFMHHVQNKTLPTPLLKIFDDVKNDLNLNTRSRTQEKLKVPFFKSSRTQKSVKYQGVSLWNSLSLNLKKLSFQKFYIEYKSNLIQNYKL